MSLRNILLEAGAMSTGESVIGWAWAAYTEPCGIAAGF